MTRTVSVKVIASPPKNGITTLQIERNKYLSDYQRQYRPQTGPSRECNQQKNE